MPIADLDLNLLTALDALLETTSVTEAARRLGLSVSATSRALTRLRAVTGDPLLVRAGSVLVPTPHALSLAGHVHDTLGSARALLAPPPVAFDPATMTRCFTLRVSEVFLDRLASELIVCVAEAAPEACLRFVAKPDKDAAPLREARIDLEIGVPGRSAPEIRLTTLFEDRLVGIVRPGHPLLCGEGPTAERYAACRHIVASRHGRMRQTIDDGLEAMGLSRQVAVVVPGYPDAMRLALASDLVALVPRSGVAGEAAVGMFEPPIALAGLRVCAMWHPRLEADPAHRWLRAKLVSICRRHASA